MRSTRLQTILRASVLILTGAAFGFGAVHFAYRRERARLVDGYYFQWPERPNLAWLKTADPLADFRGAVASGDLQFVGCRGGFGAPFVPGLDHTQHAEMIRTQGVRYLPTSASCFPNEINPDLDRAIGYARTYNVLVLHQLGQ